jgi:hypothetical protein
VLFGEQVVVLLTVNAHIVVLDRVTEIIGTIEDVEVAVVLFVFIETIATAAITIIITTIIATTTVEIAAVFALEMFTHRM